MKQPFIFTVHSKMGDMQRFDVYEATSYEVDSNGVLSIYEAVETADSFMVGECIVKFAPGAWTRVEKKPN